MIIRNLNLLDLEALSALDQACFAKPWTSEALREELTHPDAINLGLFDDRHGEEALANVAIHGLLQRPGPLRNDELVAAILTRQIAGERWIFRIMTHPDWRRQKLAEKLLLALPQEPLWLEVSVDNLGAIEFYEQAGFRTVARRPGYYPEDALVMRKKGSND